jgi:condensin complex subunit 1
MNFTDKEVKTSKAVAPFLVTMSEICRKIMLKQMVYLQEQIESESFSIRCSMLEVVANLISSLIGSNSNDNSLNQIQNFHEILQIKFMDTSSYVRSKVLQMLICLEEYVSLSKQADKSSNQEYADVFVSNIPLNVRMDLISLAIGRLRDKSNVRKNATRFLIKMIETAPFTGPTADQGKLSLKLFTARLEQLQVVLKVIGGFYYLSDV